MIIFSNYTQIPLFWCVCDKLTLLRTEVTTNNDMNWPFDYMYKIGAQIVELAMAQKSVYTMEKIINDWFSQTILNYLCFDVLVTKQLIL